MHAENFIVDEGCDGHTVENILELLPQTDTVPILALVVKSVNTIDLTAFVVTSKQEEVLLKLDLVGQQQDDSLEGLLASVDVVAQK